MRHDWIFDVLADLRSYAVKNGLPELAAQVDVTLRVARDEIAARTAVGDDPARDDEGSDGGVPPAGRRH